MINRPTSGDNTCKREEEEEGEEREKQRRKREERKGRVKTTDRKDNCIHSKLHKQ